MAFDVSGEREARGKKHEGEWKTGSRTQCELLMVPGTHPDFKKAMRSKERAYRAKNGLLGRNAEKPIPPEAHDQHWLESIAEVLIRDWRGVLIDGEPVPYSSARCVEFLDDSKLARFRLDVMDLVNADAEELDAAAGLIEKN